MSNQKKEALVFYDVVPREQTIVNITPSRRTGFSVSRDDEGTYDVHIRFNPVRFFIEATEAINTVNNFRTAIGGLRAAF